MKGVNRSISQIDVHLRALGMMLLSRFRESSVTEVFKRSMWDLYLSI